MRAAERRSTRNRPSRVEGMSPARVRPGKIVHLGDAIVAEMRAAHMPFEPRQFEFWFAYKSGRNTALNAAANDLKERNGALSGVDVERLHETYLAPWRMAARPDDIAAQM